MRKHPIISGIVAAILLSLPQMTKAAFIPPVYCGNLPGCGMSGEFISPLLTIAFTQFNIWGYVLGGFFVIVGGVHILWSLGDTEKVNKGRQTITWALIGVFIANFAQQIVNIIILEPQGVVGGPDLIINIIHAARSTVFDLLYISLFGIAVYSGMLMVVSRDKEDQFKKAMNALIFAAVGAIIVNIADSVMAAFVNI